MAQDWGGREAPRTHFKNHSARDFSYASTPPAAGPANLIFPNDPPVSIGRAPGPGAYNLQDALSLHTGVERRFESLSAAFHPPTAPRRPLRVPGAAAVAAPQPGALLAVGAGGEESGGAAGPGASSGGRARCTPGPGEYDSHAVRVAIDPSRGAAAPFVSKA